MNGPPSTNQSCNWNHAFSSFLATKKQSSLIQRDCFHCLILGNGDGKFHVRICRIKGTFTDPVSSILRINYVQPIRIVAINGHNMRIINAIAPVIMMPLWPLIIERDPRNDWITCSNLTDDTVETAAADI